MSISKDTFSHQSEETYRWSISEGCQILYLRLIPGPWRNVHPIGRPELALSPDELTQSAIVKIGSQGPNTGRQQAHNSNYPDSRLLDSFVTEDYKKVERNMKRRLRNERLLFEGTYGDKTTRDTELIVIRSQEDYDACVETIRDIVLVNHDNGTLSSLQLECEKEKTKQMELVEKTKQMELIEKTKQMELQLEMRKLDLEEKRFMFPRRVTPVDVESVTERVSEAPEEQNVVVPATPPNVSRSTNMEISPSFFSRDVYDAFLAEKVRVDYGGCVKTVDLMNEFEKWIVSSGDAEIVRSIRGGTEHSYFFDNRFKNEFVKVMEESIGKSQIRIKGRNSNTRGFRGISLVP